MVFGEVDIEEKSKRINEKRTWTDNRARRG
jgi:hypothetical protein